MKTFNGIIRGEDGTEFADSVEAENVFAANLELKERYPEGKVLEVFDPEVRAKEVEDRASRYLDDPDYDFYGD